MHRSAIAEFVQTVTSFGPVRAKYLPRRGQSLRLLGASVASGDSAITIKSEEGQIKIDLNDIEHISFASEDRKYFIRMPDALEIGRAHV